MALQRAAAYSETIADQDGNVLGTITLRPSDFKAQEAFMAIVSALMGAGKTLDALGLLDEDDEKQRAELAEQLVTSAEFEKASQYIDKQAGGMRSTVEAIDLARPHIDALFGEGSEKIILDGGYDMFFLLEVIDWAADYFEDAGQAWKQHQEKLQQYKMNRAQRRAERK